MHLTALNEGTSSADVSIAAAGGNDLAKFLKISGQSFRLDVVDGFNSDSQRLTASIPIDTDTPRGAYGGVETPTVTGHVLMYRDVSPYPFDDYVTQIAIDPTNDQSAYIDFTTQLTKTIAGRHLILDKGGDNHLLNIRRRRPRLQQLFVITCCLMYLFVVLGVAGHLFSSPASQSPQGLLITVAGFLLSAAGFRDLIGFSKLTSFSSLEALEHFS